MEDVQVRSALAQCGVKGKIAMQPIGTLSGGEQVKVKICLLMLQKCNFLILDEPTNHIDQDCKEILKENLINYVGGVILVTHEHEFYQD
jgi:ATPase subunit of ABC transporter with duplicated ATPase domains